MMAPEKFSEIFWPKESNSKAFEVFSLQGIAQCRCVHWFESRLSQNRKYDCTEPFCTYDKHLSLLGQTAGHEKVPPFPWPRMSVQLLKGCGWDANPDTHHFRASRHVEVEFLGYGIRLYT